MNTTAPATPTPGSRIELPAKARGPIARIAQFVSKRRYGVVIAPTRAYSRTPLLLAGYGAIELASERSHKCPTRIKELAVMRAAMLTGCEWCLDFGTAEMLADGVPEADLRELPNYAESERFSELERRVLDYATAMTRTPVEMSDELVHELRRGLGDDALVELTHAIALENHRARFNWALGLQSDGLTEGGFCVAPSRD